MSPTRTSTDGCFRLDWRRREIGRIARSSGEKTIKGWRRAMALLDALYDRGELEILRALKDNRLTMREITSAERTRSFSRSVGVDPVQSLALQAPLAVEVARWLDGREDVTHARYRASMQKFIKQFGQRPISALKSIDWRALRGLGVYRSGSDWNALRRAVSRFLSVTLGEHHPFRREVMEQFPKAPVRSREVNLSAEEFWRLVGAASDTVRGAIVTLAVTGMRLGEFERARSEHLLELGDGSLEIVVQGTKTAKARGRVRVDASLAAWVRDAVPWRFSRAWLHQQFWRARAAIGRTDLRLHDLRHLTAALALEGGAPINAVRDLMRHETASMSLDYARSGNVAVAAAAIGRALSDGRRKALKAGS